MQMIGDYCRDHKQGEHPGTVQLQLKSTETVVSKPRSADELDL